MRGFSKQYHPFLLGLWVVLLAARANPTFLHPANLLLPLITMGVVVFLLMLASNRLIADESKTAVVVSACLLLFWLFKPLKASITSLLPSGVTMTLLRPNYYVIPLMGAGVLGMLWVVLRTGRPLGRVVKQALMA